MKKLRLISTLLCLTLAFSCMAPALATDNSNDTMDANLRERGYPQIYLDNISPTAKESLYEKPDLTFAGATLTTFDEDTGNYESYDISPSDVAPLGQIPSADFDLSLGISRDSSSGNYFISLSYDWKKIPFERHEDSLAVSWDSSKFRMMDNSFYKIDKYDADFRNIGHIKNTITSKEKYFADGSPSGVMWYAKLASSNYDHTVTNLYGHGEFWLIPKISNIGTTVLYSKYVHAKTPTVVTINLGTYGSLSVSDPSNSNQIATQKTIKY